MKSFQRDQLEHDQVVATLKETEQQLLDVEEVAGTNQQKGVTGDNDDQEDDDDSDDDAPVGICHYGNVPPSHDDRKKPSWKSFFSFEGDLKETGPPTRDYFHTQLFFKLSLVSKEKVR